MYILHILYCIVYSTYKKLDLISLIDVMQMENPIYEINSFLSEVPKPIFD